MRFGVKNEEIRVKSEEMIFVQNALLNKANLRILRTAKYFTLQPLSKQERKQNGYGCNISLSRSENISFAIAKISLVYFAHCERGIEKIREKKEE